MGGDEMRIMRILGFTRGTGWNEMDCVQYYRCYLPLREVNRSAVGIEAQMIGSEQLVGKTDDELGDRDIYIMSRMYHVDCEGFMVEAHRRGALVVLDSDDDLTETYRLVSSRGEGFKRVLGKVDYVTTSTQVLADLFDHYTQKPTTVLKNCIDTAWMESVAGKSRRVFEGITIGFTGSPTHWGDWYIPAVPLARIVRDFDVVSLVHGEFPRYLRWITDADHMHLLSSVPFSLYPTMLRQFDIVLCSVDTKDEFSRGKSAVKALECLSLGIVPICSPFGPYLEIAEQGAPVWIVPEQTRDAWYEAMRDLLLDEERRLKLRSTGAAWVRVNKDMCVSGWKDWANFYRSIVA